VAAVAVCSGWRAGALAAPQPGFRIENADLEIFNNALQLNT